MMEAASTPETETSTRQHGATTQKTAIFFVVFRYVFFHPVLLTHFISPTPF
jgi:hypothetical protein